jgi:hypothetical protein
VGGDAYIHVPIWYDTIFSEEHTASIFRAEEYVEQHTSMKAGGKQNSWLAGFSDYVRRKTEMEEQTSVLIGSQVEQNKTTWLSHIHQVVSFNENSGPIY